MHNVVSNLARIGTVGLLLGACASEPAGSSGSNTGTINTTAGSSGSAGTGTAGSGSFAGTGAVPVGGTGGGNVGGVAGDGALAGMSGGEPGIGGGELACATTEVKEGVCKAAAEGVYAIKTEIDVWWKDNGSGLLGLGLVDPGRGKITVYLKGELTGVCEDGSNGQGTIQGCGTELPAFRSDANCDSFQIQFPDAMWDAPTMPKFFTTGHTTGFNPGDILTLDTATGLLGIDMNDWNGVWPTPTETGSFACPAGAGVDCFPDHDGDGKPGITVRMGRIGETDVEAGSCGGFGLPFVFRGAPLDSGPAALVDDAPRAEIIDIGLRIRLGGSGAIESDCASGVGDSVTEMLDNRVIDCQFGDGTPCGPAGASFVDSVAPVYNLLKKGEAPPPEVMRPSTQGGGPLDQTPSVGSRSAIVRLGDLGQSFDCAAIRNAPFPPL